MFVVLNLYMLNVDDWMWWLHVLNYVVVLLHANEGDIDGECMYENEGENDGEFVVEHVHSVSYVHAS